MFVAKQFNFVVTSANAPSTIQMNTTFFQGIIMSVIPPLLSPPLPSPLFFLPSLPLPPPLLPLPFLLFFLLLAVSLSTSSSHNQSIVSLLPSLGILPPLYKAYPNTAMEFNVNAKSWPATTITAASGFVIVIVNLFYFLL